MDPAPFQRRYSVIMRHYPFDSELNASLPNASGQGSHFQRKVMCVSGMKTDHLVCPEDDFPTK